MTIETAPATTPTSPEEEPAPSPSPEPGEEEFPPEPFELSRTHKIVDKLNDPELSGARGLHDTISHATLDTLNTVGAIGHAGRNVPAHAKELVLRGKKNRAERKHEKAQAKAARGSMLGWRQNRLDRKARDRKAKLDGATKKHTAQKDKIRVGNEEYDKKVKRRNGAYERQKQHLEEKAHIAVQRKARRYHARLERKASGRDIHPDVRRQMLEAKSAIASAARARYDHEQAKTT